ncbi:MULTISPECIES: ATP-grasp fold amidoligase family protein [unclassified Cellulophaga]|uniref:ATP-grasp fold amidoligase family protein n=1 Tax=unclassified Cellulophaga TaxID=2634405 RepID=UPI0026E1EEAE|nr:MULTISPECIES: ATP-grasp fold amidoligase family protein [unclassified Cellulophaga]MDO6490731.1 ATP-grasp fold amidoligase family protein [Cellulophaga sp. 2_MG-2023]MDO6494075.1 ATP-grasp fold amidoligase family protein [Cellulophaga sp. 3_MG-2023]
MTLRKTWVKLIKTFKFLPQKFYVRHYYEYYTGKKLDYDNPVEFNQKLSWYKVFYRNPLLPKLVNKYAVREFVEEKIGKEFLNDCIGVYNYPKDIDWSKLPEKFVIKGVHGCNFNLVVTDKSKINKTKANLKMYKWLNKNQYYRGGLEWAYKDVKPQLIIEKFMKDDITNDLIDYKFYCFDGEPKFLVAQSDSLGRYFYDLKWQELPFRWKKEYKNSISKPSNFNELIELSKKLSSGFPFVRVDFYSVNNKTIFGEMTFYPTDARDDFYPEKYNKIIGDYFKLPTV